MTKKRPFLFFCLLFCLLQVRAAQNYTLVVEASNGSLTRFLLQEKPILTFAVHQLAVTVDDNAIRYDLDNVNRFYFEDSTPTNIPSVESDNLLISKDGHDYLTIKNANQVDVFTAAGIHVDGRVSMGDRQATVSLRSLPAGIYLININHHKTIKITKK